MASCPHISGLYVPNQDSKLFKDECVLCFDDITDKGGLDVCLTCFQGNCTGALNHSYQHRQRSKHPITLNIKRLFKPKQEEKEITSVEIGGEGGARLDEMAGSYDDHYSVYCHTCESELDRSLPQLSGVVEAVLSMDSEGTKSSVAAWKQQILPCEHVLCLQQLPNAPKLASKSMSHCGLCDLDSNLWLCLTCGHLGCGRTLMEFGSNINLGGNGHALTHHEATGHPVCVKTGTITPTGSADLWCYACVGGGNDVLDPNLGDHLAHFGIELQSQTKTEKTLAEMSLEQNLKLNFYSSKENGKSMKPLYGSGLTGMNNIGNSCYLSSVIQCIAAIPVFQNRYFMGNHEQTCEQHPADCYQCQMAKLFDGLHSGRYSKKKELQRIGEKKEGEEKKEEAKKVDNEEEQRGVGPRMFKRLISKGHEDFSSMQQQDAYEFYQHLVKMVERFERPSGKGKDPSKCLSLRYEQRNQCQECQHVRYSSVDQAEIKFEVPLQCAEPPLVAVEGEKKDQVQEREQLSFVPFSACLAQFREPELIRGFRCPICKKTTSLTKSVRISKFPEYMMANVGRFTYDGWANEARKLHVNLKFDDVIDFRVIAAGAHPEGEKLFPDGEGESKPQINEGVVNQLVEMGFERDVCEYAVEKTGNSGVELAAGWLFENAHNPETLAALESRKKKPSGGGAGSFDAGSVDMICSMGFTPAQARHALKETGQDVERAVDWLFNHPDEPIVDPAEEAPAAEEDEKEEKESGDPLYELFGVVQHRGTSIGSGHYVAYLKRGGQWVQFNDSKVTESLEPPVGQGSMFFFKKVSS